MGSTVVTPQIEEFIRTQSWIRRMFEAALELKRKVGDDNVYDFSLGNPDVPAPAEVGRALREISALASRPLAFGYVPNAGAPGVRAALARKVAAEQQCDVQAGHVVLTCGAAGALNVLFRAVLEPGDEVVCPAPYFVEYGFYAGNFGGVLKPVPARPLSFELDLDALAAAIGPRTRAVLINSPNNPTGQLYSREELERLAAILADGTRRHGRPIFLISDEPYRFLTYDGLPVPPVLPLYPYTVVVSSFSKSLSLAGVRLGYVAANPGMPDVQTLVGALTLTNRILGFVNAPVIAQYIVERTLDAGVDIRIYDERRHAMARMLRDAGVAFTMPKGAFYFFPQVPGGLDDQAFVDRLLEHNIIAVPGTGFGAPGYFRLTYCVDRRIIEAAAPHFRAAVAGLARR